VDRSLHLYEEPKKTAVKASWYSWYNIIRAYTPPPVAGAHLVYAITKAPQTAQIMQKISARTGFPYGPKVRDCDIDKYIRYISLETEFDDTSYVAIGENELKDSKTIQKERQMFHYINGWYSGLRLKQEEIDHGETWVGIHCQASPPFSC
jgi:hypothetical protein